MNKAAQALGRLNKGVKKKITPKRRKQLAEQLAKYRHMRWSKKSD